MDTNMQELVDRYKSHLNYAVRNSRPSRTGPTDHSFVFDSRRFIEQIGEPVIEIASQFYESEDKITRRYSIESLGLLGDSALWLLRKAIKDSDSAVRLQAVEEMRQIGLPALQDLEESLKDGNKEVKKQSIKSLGIIRESEPKVFCEAFKDEDPEIRIAVLDAFPQCEEAIDTLIRAINDPNLEVRRRAIHIARKNIGLSALRPIILATENTDGLVASEALYYLTDREFYHFWNGVSGRFFPEKYLDYAVTVIMDDLIIRKSGAPSDGFNPKNISKILQALTSQNPMLNTRINKDLLHIASSYQDEPRNRAIAVARNLSPEEFASLVKNLGSEHLDVATQIMRELGGSEATAYFTEAQSQTLAEYRAPLIDLEEMARQRWEELTAEAKRSSATSKWMSIGVFIVGTSIVVWAFILLSLSNEPWQQLAAALAGVGSFLALYSQRFWKEPVEQIQRFSSQQARLQIAFIGFMNRVAQIRLVFEDAYAKDKLPPETMAMYQQWLNEATDKAWQQLSDAAITTANQVSNSES